MLQTFHNNNDSSKNGFKIDNAFFSNVSLRILSPLQIEAQIIEEVGVACYVSHMENTNLGQIIKERSNINAPVENVAMFRHQGTNLMA